jgi:hypothetical protein
MKLLLTSSLLTTTFVFSRYNICSRAFSFNLQAICVGASTTFCAYKNDISPYLTCILAAASAALSTLLPVSLPAAKEERTVMDERRNEGTGFFINCLSYSFRPIH